MSAIPEPTSTMVDDPVVVYDVMWEAANRLGAVYAQQVTSGGVNDPAIAKMRALDAEVEAVDPDDLDAQKAKTVDLRRRYEQLFSG